MNNLPPEPSFRDNVSATWMRNLLRYVRSIALVKGPGYRLRRGPNGTSIEFRVSSSSAASEKLPGCWEMTLEKSEEESEEPTYTATFENRYYSVGGRTYHSESTTLEDLTGTEIVALKIDIRMDEPTEELVKYADLGKLQEGQEDDQYYVIPLYKIEDGKVTCDFRLGASAAMGEFPTP